MSSNKDYILDITPADVTTANLIKFTVRHKHDPVLVRHRWAITALLQIVLLVLVWSYWSEIKEFTIPTHITIIIAAQAIVLLKQSPTDSVIAIKNVGIQLISRKGWRFLSDEETFIPINDIIDLVIHEGFHGYGQVIFYLCALTRLKENSTKSDSTTKNDIIKIFFQKFLPRKDVLLKVWKLSKQLLFADTRSYWRRVPGKGLQKI